MSEKDSYQLVMQELTTAAGDPLETLESLGGRMGTLWAAAEASQNAELMQIVSNAWDGINAMSQQTGTAVNIAAAARKVAEGLQAQRDAVAKQHGQLVNDVVQMNTDNPLVSELVGAVQQDYEEDLLYSDVYMSSDPGDDIVNSINAIPVTMQEARMFFDMLMGGYELEDVFREKLAGFIQHFVKEVTDYEQQSVNVDDIDEVA